MRSLILLSLFLSSFSIAQPEALGDASLSQVTGQSGIRADLSLDLNTNADGYTPVWTSCGASGGGVGTTGNPCRIALQFNNRISGGGEWLVLKDIYGGLRISNLDIDGYVTPTAASSFADDSRFQDASGNCLLSGTGACAGRAKATPALQMAFKNAASSYGDYTYTGATSGAGAFEPDIQLFLNIGRAAVEYGATGYAADLRGSFMGLSVSDTRGATVGYRAQMDIDGRVFLSGF